MKLQNHDYIKKSKDFTYDRPLERERTSEERETERKETKSLGFFYVPRRKKLEKGGDVAGGHGKHHKKTSDTRQEATDNHAVHSTNRKEENNTVSRDNRIQKDIQRRKSVDGQKRDKALKDSKIHFSGVRKPEVRRKEHEYGWNASASSHAESGKPAEAGEKHGKSFKKSARHEERESVKTKKKDNKIYSGKSVKERPKRDFKKSDIKRAIRRRKFEFMVNKLSGDPEQKDSLSKTAKDIAVMRASLVAKKLIMYLLGLIAPLLGVLVMIALPFILIIVILYNSPMALFLPPLNDGETVQSVLSGYYRELNEEIREAEEESDESVTYKNTLNGVARSNFTDVMMVYMVTFGTGQGNFSTVMNDANKEKLKKIFDEMNHFEAREVTETLTVGESLSEMTFSGYCNCSICCGQWSGGPTASGVMPRANHTLAVDAYNPTLPMGTHIVAGGREYIIEDTGDFDRYGVDFDMYFGDHQAAQDFGHQKMEVFLPDSNGSQTVDVTHRSLYVYNLTYEDYIALGKLEKSQEELLRQVMSEEFLQSMPVSGIGEQVAVSALAKVGCQYSQDLRYEEGYYDCSSLVQRCYAEFGINLPSVSSTQGQYIVDNGLQVNENELKPGDLIFHSRDTNTNEFLSIGHVAIYVGNGMQVDARGTAYGVVYRPLVPSNIGLYGRPCR